MHIISMCASKRGRTGIVVALGALVAIQAVRNVVLSLHAEFVLGPHAPLSYLGETRNVLVVTTKEL